MGPWIEGGPLRAPRVVCGRFNGSPQGPDTPFLGVLGRLQVLSAAGGTEGDLCGACNSHVPPPNLGGKQERHNRTGRAEGVMRGHPGGTWTADDVPVR